MKVIAKAGNEDIATVYVAEMANGERIEFAESVQPPIPRDDKWVLCISTLYGCPGGCRMCDAGGHFHGKLSFDDIMSQIDYLVDSRYPSRAIPAGKFKIQFARMGEPALNDAVIDVLESLPQAFDAPGLIPSISTVAPDGCDGFFEQLLRVKDKLYGKRFQLQFSIHTTDKSMRDWLMPIRKWDFGIISEYGERFQRAGERKITLNFALVRNAPIDTDMLLDHFDPSRYLIKLTPLNPTNRARGCGLESLIQSRDDHVRIVDELRNADYEVVVSIGDFEENRIGSNCGQYVSRYNGKSDTNEDAYTYPLVELV